MWGEYVPFEDAFPFLWALTPNEASFTPGSKAGVFELAQPAIEFSVLICFEDTLPYLSRRAVKEGARLLVNQTNDAWFERSWASRQHMAHCVFRCIENRVPAVRCANNGVSCFIDSNGTIMDLHGHYACYAPFFAAWTKEVTGGWFWGVDRFRKVSCFHGADVKRTPCLLS